MAVTKLRRSVLYLPAVNARAIEKARTLACDTVILDLEDSIAPDMKAEARERAVTAVREGGFGYRELVVRVNGADTAWHDADIVAVQSVRPNAILLPKVNGPADVAAFADRTGRQVPIWAMIETAKAMFHLDAIATTAKTDRLACFVMGSNDLLKELRARTPGRATVMPFLMMTVAAARAHEMSVLDGVFNAFEDEDGFAAECAEGASLGFDGKTLIHPKQIAPANLAFSPSPEEIEWARKVVAAFDNPENADRGAIRIEGKMVERMHLAQALDAIALNDAATGVGF